MIVCPCEIQAVKRMTLEKQTGIIMKASVPRMGDARFFSRRI